MSLHLVAVTSDAPDPAASATFWGALLDRSPVRDAGGLLLPGDDTQIGLRFVAASGERTGANRLHLHLTSTSLEDQQQTVETAHSLGARPGDVRLLPEDDHVVVTDPAGDDFCVIPPGNNFLAGCGRLGEVSCDGTRAVGLFWRDALGWPLVWDQDEETAIQSPAGGTKVSWGGPPVAEKHGRNRHRLHLLATDLADDVARLVELGAARLGDRDDGVELSDPDDNEFLVVAG